MYFSWDIKGETSKYHILHHVLCCNTEITSNFERDVTAIWNWNSITDSVTFFIDLVFFTARFIFNQLFYYLWFVEKSILWFNFGRYLYLSMFWCKYSQWHIIWVCKMASNDILSWYILTYVSYCYTVKTIMLLLHILIGYNVLSLSAIVYCCACVPFWHRRRIYSELGGVFHSPVAPYICDSVVILTSFYRHDLWYR